MKYSGIGGQAVIEGIMMKNGDRYATAVRKPDGDLSLIHIWKFWRRQTYLPGRLGNGHRTAVCVSQTIRMGFSRFLFRTWPSGFSATALPRRNTARSSRRSEPGRAFS